LVWNRTAILRVTRSRMTDFITTFFDSINSALLRLQTRRDWSYSNRSTTGFDFCIFMQDEVRLRRPNFQAWKTLRTHLIVNAQYRTLKPDYDLHRAHSSWLQSIRDADACLRRRSLSIICTRSLMIHWRVNLTIARSSRKFYQNRIYNLVKNLRAIVCILSTLISCDLSHHGLYTDANGSRGCATSAKFSTRAGSDFRDKSTTAWDGFQTHLFSP
jgi:hypothetical protein